MIKIGDIVRMTDLFLFENRWNLFIKSHIEEFGNCFGLVEDLCFEGLVDSEVNVRWFPSGFRYAYSPNDLEIINLLVL